MNSKTFSLLFGGLALALSAGTASATSYNGNGSTGFGNGVGTGVLSITSTSTNINFSFTPGTGGVGNNALVLYIDSVAGGANSTSTYTDNANAGRLALSGLSGNGRTLATFAPGFGADYGISIEPGTGNFVGLYNLSTPSNFTFLTSGGLASAGGAFTFSFLKSDLGLPANGGGFTFEGSLISTTGYRSNETIGTSATTPGTLGDTPNAGFTGTTTFATANTFLVPEPNTCAAVGLGLAALAALNRRRSRRAV